MDEQAFRKCVACGIVKECLYLGDVCKDCLSLAMIDFEWKHGGRVWQFAADDQIERASKLLGTKIANEPAKTFMRKKLNERVTLSVFRRDDFTCQQCGSSSDLTIDHIHPVALGGSNEIENLQTLCKSCNSRKGARLS